MGFEFTNKPPPMAGATNAFRPLPSLRSANPTSRTITGPAVNAQQVASPATRVPIAFGVRSDKSVDTQPNNSDALSFFSKPDLQSRRRQIWDYEEEHDPSKKSAGKYFTCDCQQEASRPRIFYQPSTAAHTIRSYDSDSAGRKAPFRFLDLPGEMRNRVYRAALSPPYISLKSCADHHFPLGVSPAIATGILAASKQLAQESKDIIMESTFIVNVSLETTNRSAINPQQLPGKVLPNVQHMVMVIDFTRFWATYDLDWRTVQKMTALKTLRICGIHVWPPASGLIAGNTLQKHQNAIIKSILECIPAACSVEFGSGSLAEDEHVGDMHRRICLLGDRFHNAEITDPAELLAAAEATKDETRKGWKNGSSVDYRFVQ